MEQREQKNKKKLHILTFKENNDDTINNPAD